MNTVVKVKWFPQGPTYYIPSIYLFTPIIMKWENSIPTTNLISKRISAKGQIYSYCILYIKPAQSGNALTDMYVILL